MSKNYYYKIALIIIRQDIIDKYNLMDKQINGFICARMEKGMYGLSQDGIIEHKTLKEHIYLFRY